MLALTGCVVKISHVINHSKLVDGRCVDSEGRDLMFLCVHVCHVYTVHMEQDGMHHTRQQQK